MSYALIGIYIYPFSLSLHICLVTYDILYIPWKSCASTACKVGAVAAVAERETRALLESAPSKHAIEIGPHVGPRGGAALDAADARSSGKFCNSKIFRCGTLQLVGTFLGRSFMTQCNIVYCSDSYIADAVSLGENT